MKIQAGKNQATELSTTFHKKKMDKDLKDLEAALSSLLSTPTPKVDVSKSTSNNDYTAYSPKSNNQSNNNTYSSPSHQTSNHRDPYTNNSTTRTQASQPARNNYPSTNHNSDSSSGGGESYWKSRAEELERKVGSLEAKIKGLAEGVKGKNLLMFC